VPPRRSAAPAGPPGPSPSPARPPDGAAESPAGAGPAAAAVGAFIERFAGLLYEAGMPRMPARVFTALLAADAGRLTAADLGGRLGVSPAAVSGAVRYLAQLGLVATTGEPGSRRLSYRVPDDVWGQLAEARNATMARMSATLLDGVALLGAGTPAGQRLAGTARYFDFVLGELADADERWRQFAAGRDGSVRSAAGHTGADRAGPDGARAGGRP
jgi:predicted transcriptional regulator